GERDTGDVGGPVAEERRHGEAHLLRLTHPLDHLRGDESVDEVLRGVVHQRGADGVRGDGVDPHAPAAVLEGGVLGQADDAVLARRVRADEVDTGQSGDRRHVDDRATPASTIAGIAYLRPRNTPLRLMTITRSNSSGVTSVSSLWTAMPALFTASSSEPSVATVRSTRACTSSGRVTNPALPSTSSAMLLLSSAPDLPRIASPNRPRGQR